MLYKHRSITQGEKTKTKNDYCIKQHKVGTNLVWNWSIKFYPKICSFRILNLKEIMLNWTSENFRWGGFSSERRKFVTYSDLELWQNSDTWVLLRVFFLWVSLWWVLPSKKNAWFLATNFCLKFHAIPGIRKYISGTNVSSGIKGSLYSPWIYACRNL